MTIADTDQALVEFPTEYDHWFTTGNWPTESESAAEFDRLVDNIGLFRLYPEVMGTLVQPRAGQIGGLMRIDRVLMPTRELVDQGWAHGAIGVEIKRSKENIGPPLAQAMDYVRGSWNVVDFWIQLSAVFLWPMRKQGGPLASLMSHNRIGSVSHDRNDLIKFAIGEEVLIAHNAYSGVRMGSNRRSGRKVGSR